MRPPCLTCAMRPEKLEELESAGWRVAGSGDNVDWLVVNDTDGARRRCWQLLAQVSHL
ncbi:hypothetical protein KCP69_11370 [Salmonella enterica subsp. enterica]|nr:hypothetical protein KCP69_11370 [Salmonella enterica subsp. enterica]